MGAETPAVGVTMPTQFGTIMRAPQGQELLYSKNGKLLISSEHLILLELQFDTPSTYEYYSSDVKIDANILYAGHASHVLLFSQFMIHIIFIGVNP